MRQCCKSITAVPRACPGPFCTHNCSGDAVCTFIQACGLHVCQPDGTCASHRLGSSGWFTARSEVRSWRRSLILCSCQNMRNMTQKRGDSTSRTKDVCLREVRRWRRECTKQRSSANATDWSGRKGRRKLAYLWTKAAVRRPITQHLVAARAPEAYLEEVLDGCLGRRALLQRGET